MSNNRVFYATQRFGIAPLGSNTYTTVRGGQTLNMTTTFNLEQAFEIGQLAIYENIEGIPDVELTVEKALDGHCPAYLLATQLADSATLTGRSTAKCSVAVSVYDDTNESATGSVGAEVIMSGLYPNSVGYSVTTDGFATESLTLIGNNKTWVGQVDGVTAASYADDPFSGNDDFPAAIAGSGGVNRREDVLFIYNNAALDANGATKSTKGTVLPTDIPGISSSGTNDKVDGNYQAHISSFSSTVDFARDDLFELGRRGQYHRYITFPVEVTTEIGVTASSGDLVSCTEAGINAGTGDCPVGTNLSDETIRLNLCEGLMLDVGKNNKLASVGVTGGDAGGGNVEVTYTYTNFNDFTVYHTADPNRGDSSFQPDYTIN